MAYVRVRENCAIHWQGGLTVLRAGEKYEDSDPLVREFPGHFESDDPEMATAAPGDRRGARR